MNAPTKLAHFQAMAKRALRADDAEITGPVQPQIDVDLTLLHSGYQESVGYLTLDLYGNFDREDGYFVEAVAVTGTTVDLSELMRDQQMIDLSTWCDLTLPDAAKMDEDAKNEAAIDRAESRKESQS